MKLKQIMVTQYFLLMVPYCTVKFGADNRFTVEKHVNKEKQKYGLQARGERKMQ